MTRRIERQEVKCALPECKNKFKTARLGGLTAKRFCNSKCQQKFHHKQRQKILHASGQIEVKAKARKPRRPRTGYWQFVEVPYSLEDLK